MKHLKECVMEAKAEMGMPDFRKRVEGSPLMRRAGVILTIFLLGCASGLGVLVALQQAVLLVLGFVVMIIGAFILILILALVERITLHRIQITGFSWKLKVLVQEEKQLLYYSDTMLPDVECMESADSNDKMKYLCKEIVDFPIRAYEVHGVGREVKTPEIHLSEGQTVGKTVEEYAVHCTTLAYGDLVLFTTDKELWLSLDPDKDYKVTITKFNEINKIGERK